jgi:hypothetical protein
LRNYCEWPKLKITLEEMMEKQPQAAKCDILIKLCLLHPTSRKSGLRRVEGSRGSP